MGRMIKRNFFFLNLLNTFPILTDAVSQRSMSSVGTEEMPHLDERVATATGTENNIGNVPSVIAPANESMISRRSFGTSFLNLII